MAYAEGVERWQACRWSIAFGWASPQVQREMEESYRENFGCNRSEIIDSGKYPVSDYLDRKDNITYEVAVLSESGRFTEDSVIKALNQACLGCKFFQDRWGR